MSAFARFRLFRPILAGATTRERLFASLAAGVGIGLSALVVGLLAPGEHAWLWIVPPMGASAVLVFAVPASPMAQPWPTIGGNVVSALIGLAVAHWLPASALTAGLAVCLAIAAMSVLRCLHPPGGAAALVGFFAGAQTSYLFPLLPVGLNAVVLVACGWAFHRLMGRRYPHVAAPAAAPPAPAPKAGDAAPWTFSRSDIAETLAEMGETYDISPDDLEAVLRRVERRALARSYRTLTCADLMHTPVVAIAARATTAQARDLLVRHDVRRLPVLDGEGRLVGAVGLRELATPDAAGDAVAVETVMAPAAAVRPDSPAIGLLERYASERVHAVFVVDETHRPLGVVTEADWLAVLTRGLD